MIKIIPNAPLGGQVNVCESKALAHRYLICAALSEHATRVICNNNCDDVRATRRCLESLGLGGHGIAPSLGNEAFRLDCAESGSTLRFLLPVAAALGKSCEFILRGSLAGRPVEPLLKAMRAHGVHYEISAYGADVNMTVVRISGRLTAGTFVVPGNISSQFVSGLMFAAPLLSEPSKIIVEGRLESKPYADMTKAVLKQAGITVTEEAGRRPISVLYGIPGGQTYDLAASSESEPETPPRITVEPDWSQAALWLCAGAIGTAPVTCTGMNLNSLQGDKEILNIMRLFGANIELGAGRHCGDVTVFPGPLKGQHVDVSNCPDLVPAIALLACCANGITLINGASRLKLKESDRLRSVCTALKELGAQVDEVADGLIIIGMGSERPALKGGCVDSFNDHRVCMMETLAAAVAAEPVTIENAGAVDKSCPDFYLELEQLMANDNI